ncbi:hypothetical protein BD410DRAFT_849519 [Rickenella mellea]|uniref:MHYT domain-containing protein n=1 Tax=Rickenella mellea TaxID=50990 RepID=A0A4R5XF83_9AGAM|nr:hypothetical protein BD410DRAFT_849519 [Rickenella mellea]
MTPSNALTKRVHAGVVVACIVNASLASLAVSSVLRRVYTRTVGDKYKIIHLLLASINLTFGLWSSHSQPTSENATLFLNLSPGPVVLSLVFPLLLICITVVSSDLAQPNMSWKRLVPGASVGLSLAIMHYSSLLSLPHLHVKFAIIPTIFAIALCIILSTLLSSGTLARYWNADYFQWALPAFLGCGICGLEFLMNQGLAFYRIKGSEDTSGSKSQWNLLTMVIPAVVSFVFGCVVAWLSFPPPSKGRLTPTGFPRLSIASISYTTDGRMLCTEVGMLPTQTVNLSGIDEDIMEAFNPASDTFRWLFMLSYNWNVVAAFADRILARSQHSMKNRVLAIPRAALRFILSHRWRAAPLPVDSILKMRILEAIARLSQDMNVPIDQLGCLSDRISCSRTNAATNVVDEKAPDTGDVEEALQGHDGMKAVTLFLVRHLPQTNLSADYAVQIFSNGYRLSPAHEVRKVLSAKTGAAECQIDAIFCCLNDVKVGSRKVLQPDRTYLSLFVERSDARGSQEILVYDFARYQVPSICLDIGRLTPDMRDWVRNAAGVSIEDILDMCNEDISDIVFRRSSLSTEQSSYTSCISERPLGSSILDLQEALTHAIDELLSRFDFIPRLSSIGKLSSEIVEVPSLQSRAARLIVIKVDLSDAAEPPTIISSCADDRYTRMPRTTGPALPSTFAYTPKHLFDAAQSIMGNNNITFNRKTLAELDGLYSSGRRTELPRTPNSVCPHRSALVSTFSLDTVIDMQSPKTLKTHFSLTSIRSWASSVTTTMRTQTEPPSPSSMRTVFEHHLPQYPLLTAQPQRKERRQGKASRHPYLHLRLPPPMIFSNDANASNNLNNSLESPCSVEYPVISSHSVSNLEPSAWYKGL